MAETKTAPAAQEPAKEITADSIAAEHPQIAEHFRAEGRTEGATKERARILGIEEQALEGHEALIAECKRDPSCSPEQAAVKVLQAQRAAAAAAGEKGKSHLAQLKADEEQLDKPTPGAGATEPSADEKQAGEIVGVLSLLGRTKQKAAAK